MAVAIGILAVTTGILGVIGTRIATIGVGTTGVDTTAGERMVAALQSMIEIKQARVAGLYLDGGLVREAAMKTSISKTWLGIGIVTLSMLLASSAATSPALAASFSVDASDSAAAVAFGARQHDRSSRVARSTAPSPRYYGRPIAYAPAYPPGPFVLFTPFVD
ncbi:hypothetical protein ACQR1Y_30055 [Bradyrhizobium sp. HKCCYLRH3099]|uniref:hypothetical protein n=1 Tax=unclassified Bradyrhizobium TaxID=2631580 RepID=UPI003EBB4476